MREHWLLLGLWVGVAGAAPSDADERARIAAERQQIVERYAAEERACRDRFVVSACIEDVRVRRRDALAPLREREMALDDAERQAKAAQRRAAIGARRASEAGDAPPPPPPELRLRAPHAAASGNAHGGPRRTPDTEARAAEAARRARAAARRSAEAASTQAEVARREAERAAQGKVSRPLPLPASAALR